MHLFHHHSYLFKLIFLNHQYFHQLYFRPLLKPIFLIFVHPLIYLQHSVFYAASSAITYVVHHAACQVCSPMYLRPITPFLMVLALQTHLTFFLYQLKFFHQKSQLGFSQIYFLCFGIGHRLFQTGLTYLDYFAIKELIIVRERLRFLTAGLSLTVIKEHQLLLE